MRGTLPAFLGDVLGPDGTEDIRIPGIKFIAAFFAGEIGALVDSGVGLECGKVVLTFGCVLATTVFEGKRVAHGGISDAVAILEETKECSDIRTVATLPVTIIMSIESTN